ncbi:hypothetical protein VIOR3934_15796 [Vibrio orientalis CIP 102891 = ATCC 33934]|uniref:DUF2931 family protein n=1 Tax=Vibrio orientalis CIP 102891 = ATCC 33934 TaxID=675816 RepID=C9QI60_VIBOR|nr:DUF2931 family protein [Vibrio orientalis]EEX92499.1 hypothetical protein VIA_003144 [Vibrio orientalis CIP 102891 = ATCC 33934]EGU48001.1 hypothetical protein VIOR3934_15796 [Vibrio orientalis CIP 102891 = ATCC 33934]
MKQLMATLLLLVPVVSNAFAKVPSVPEDMPQWRIGYAMSSLYPAKVTEAYGVNEEQDWTSSVHNDMHFMRRSDLNRIRQDIADYDGFGLVLGTPVTKISQVTGTQTLPDSVYLYWASISNQRFFTTKWDLPADIKTLMSTKETFTRYDGVVRDCYRTDMIFGFLPNGNTKVWLRGCGEYKYITELAPDAELEADTFGNDAAIYRANYSKRIAERSEDAGALLDPIPWDRVNKVYSDIN